MQDAETETGPDVPPAALARPVIVTVHGTHDADASDQGTRWWQQGAVFTQKLAAELASRGVMADIMALRWSGANSDHQRLIAAKGLAHLAGELERQGRRYAVIGHSHGGNVVMEGMGAVRSAPGLAAIVTFGTPFFVRRLKLVPLLIALFQVLLAVTMVPLMAYYFIDYWSYLWSQGLYAKLIEPIVAFGGIGAATLWAGSTGGATLTRRARVKARLARTVKADDWLVIHSPRDEAMRLLETAAQLRPTYVTTAWAIRSLTGYGTIAGLGAVAATLWLAGDYLTRPLREKLMAGEVGVAAAADLTFLLVLPVVFFAAWLGVWIVARLGGGAALAFVVNRFISGGIVGAAFGGDGREALVGVQRTPPAMASVTEARIEALDLGGIDDDAIFASAKDIYESILADDSEGGGFGDPDKMWKMLSDALYHNAYMRDDQVIAGVAEYLAERFVGKRTLA